MNPGLLLLLLLGVFVVVAGVMLWQERHGDQEYHPVYVLNDAAAYVAERTGLAEPDAFRILEAEVAYLQGLAGDDGPPVAGSPAAIAVVARRTAEAGHRYSTEVIAQVMAAEAEYLESIGAFAGVAGEDQP